MTFHLRSVFFHLRFGAVFHLRFGDCPTSGRMEVDSDGGAQEVSHSEGEGHQNLNQKLPKD